MEFVSVLKMRAAQQLAWGALLQKRTYIECSLSGGLFGFSVDSTLYLGHWSQAEECQASYHLLIGIFLDEHFSNANHFLLPFPLLKTILRARLIRLCMFSLLLSSDQPRQDFFWKENWFSHLSSSLTFSVPSSNDLWGGHLKALISLVNDPILTKKQFPVAKPNS